MSEFSAPASRAPLAIGSKLTRKELQQLLGITEPTSQGAWGTGYTRHDGEFYIFVNVGEPGRTGHDYDNRWEDDSLWWSSKGPAAQDQPEMRHLLTPGTRCHIFTREEERSAFMYQGLGVPQDVSGDRPVRLRWTFPERAYAAAVAEEDGAEAERVYAPIPDRLGPELDSTDQQRMTKARLEQKYLRDELFKGPNPYVCDLCGRGFERRYLIAAHVKPRKDCTHEERLDAKNIVIRACVFGCDAFFERRDLIVDAEGCLRAPYRHLLTPDEQELIDRRVGRPAPGFTPGRRAYFAAHRALPRRS